MLANSIHDQRLADLEEVKASDPADRQEMLGQQ